MKERCEARILGAIRWSDAVTAAPIELPLVARSNQLRFVRNLGGTLSQRQCIGKLPVCQLHQRLNTQNFGQLVFGINCARNRLGFVYQRQRHLPICLLNL